MELKVLLGFGSWAFKVNEFLEILLNGGLGGWLGRCSEVPGGGPQPGVGYFIAITLMTLSCVHKSHRIYGSFGFFPSNQVLASGALARVESPRTR